MLTDLAIIEISADDDSAIILERWADPFDETADGYICLKLRHKGKYRSVLLEPQELSCVVRELVNAGKNTWGRKFTEMLTQ